MSAASVASVPLADRIARLAARVATTPEPPVEGRLVRMVGLTLEAAGCVAAIGDRCELVTPAGVRSEAEVVGFNADRLFLMPTAELHGLESAARVIPTRRAGAVRVGEGLLGRIIDAAGQPLDGRGPILADQQTPLMGRPVNPLLRHPVEEPLDVGVRTINALLTVGRGQRIGLFAGSGVGKSALLGMMARYTTADIIVVGLVGERGREVKEFIERILGPEGLARAVVVAAPADHPPLMRLHGAWLATAIAEYFRERGRSVLLLMDSLTRFAQAQREIGLAIGESPATKGYPPSVFARLPALVERAGNDATGRGSITGFYTVLTEGDDQQDPIADAARAILDGHIVLSRRLAEAGHYPAIDVEASISRVMHDIVGAEQWQAARELRRVLATYSQSREIVNFGAWKPGANPELDRAVALWPRIAEFLQQDLRHRAPLAESVDDLGRLMAAAPPDGERE